MEAERGRQCLWKPYSPRSWEQKEHPQRGARHTLILYKQVYDAAVRSQTLGPHIPALSGTDWQPFLSQGSFPSPTEILLRKPQPISRPTWMACTRRLLSSRAAEAVEVPKEAAPRCRPRMIRPSLRYCSIGSQKRSRKPWTGKETGRSREREFRRQIPQTPSRWVSTCLPAHPGATYKAGQPNAWGPRPPGSRAVGSCGYLSATPSTRSSTPSPHPKALREVRSAQIRGAPGISVQADPPYPAPYTTSQSL